MKKIEEIFLDIEKKIKEFVKYIKEIWDNIKLNIIKYFLKYVNYIKNYTNILNYKIDVWEKYIIEKFWNNVYNNKIFIIKHELPYYCYGYGMLEAIRNNNMELVKQFLLYAYQINNFMFEYCLICCWIYH